MIPEIILQEEKLENYPILIIIGLISVLIAYVASSFMFPSHIGLVTVVFAAIPIVYPLMQYIINQSQEKHSHIPEILTYFSIFVGQVAGFFILSLFSPETFSTQVSVIEERSTVEIIGYATQADVTFLSIFLNNMLVYTIILLTAALLGSSGAFILAWNASVLGIFLGSLTSYLYEYNLSTIFTGTSETPTPLAFLPHATVEMLGFIIAGIVGTLISASIYNSETRKEIWKDYAHLVILGASLILFAALIETL